MKGSYANSNHNRKEEHETIISIYENNEDNKNIEVRRQIIKDMFKVKGSNISIQSKR